MEEDVGGGCRGGARAGKGEVVGGARSSVEKEKIPAFNGFFDSAAFTPS